MAYVQNRDRDGKLKSGPLSKYADEITEAQQKDLKKQEEKLRKKFEQESSEQRQKSREAESLEKIRKYKERQKQKAQKMSSIAGKNFKQLFTNRTSSLSGTTKARIARNEGGTSAKG